MTTKERNTNKAYRDTLINILRILNDTLVRQHKKYLEAGVIREKALKEYYDALDKGRSKAISTGDAYDRALSREMQEYDRERIIFEIRLMMRSTIKENTDILGGE